MGEALSVCVSDGAEQQTLEKKESIEKVFLIFEFVFFDL